MIDRTISVTMKRIILIIITAPRGTFDDVMLKLSASPRPVRLLAVVIDGIVLPPVHVFVVLGEAVLGIRSEGSDEVPFGRLSPDGNDWLGGGLEVVMKIVSSAWK